MMNAQKFFSAGITSAHDLMQCQQQQQQSAMLLKSQQQEQAQANKLQSLRQEILSSLPQTMDAEPHAQNKPCNCQLNKTLLEYFVNAELVKLQQPTGQSSVGRTEQSLLEIQASVVEAKEEVKTEKEEIIPAVKQESQLSKQNLECLQETNQKIMLITKCPHVHRKHYAKVRRSSLNISEHVLKLLQKVWKEPKCLELLPH